MPRIVQILLSEGIKPFLWGEGEVFCEDSSFLGQGQNRHAAEEREKEVLRLSRRMLDLLTLARRIVKGEGIEESELRSGIRKREVARGRRIFCQLAIREMGYSGAEAARFLGVTTSAVNRFAFS
jgi:hypothetical protein